VRLRVKNETIIFEDMVLGRQVQNLEQQVGDFVLHRADGVFAYQLAVVVDDIDSGVTQVVRGADLLSSTPRQIYLYHCLESKLPEYLHLPLAFGQNDKKLSKRNGSFALICRENGSSMLWRALDFLGQSPPAELFDWPAGELLAWGAENFQISKIPAQNRQITFS
jgi:glutamyl-Q tRNA(Asp) synthetase